mmetsp:Transcript_4370/g.7738  ORF Transcript_4370/g.7738 Transcript_4370/m.7738 type:complete len:407 (+) Transcript_4370:91-1311(+)|eukprot:CAMPEP_0197633712 /NCGR_PEP_ID=MMETSP1338-20131121/10015_1 /TAXON_ID=43686 ORGANISM="Pelagodinium beii, Strain RCC1491" /NCGR_SAMPLE_ID=MMETSP1338 /ASSEMBLY_ACC=CAM_ASM_000754 /LENGTH=406 /DNA_ID=CAMNT_0043205435 /DNA_START=60 /DNA_END=1280 /DNA_ORIENTATION=-
MAPAEPYQLDAFLQGLLSESTSKIETMGKEIVMVKDPFVEGLVRQEQAARDRKAAHQARWAALDSKMRDEVTEGTEPHWRQQIQKRKEEERQKKKEAAAKAIEEAALAKAVKEMAILLPGDVTLELLNQDKASRQKAKEQAQAAVLEQEKLWMENEFLPQLERRKVENRQRRLDAERRMVETEMAEFQRLERENSAMAREEENTRSYLAHLDQESHRLSERAKTPRVRSGMERKVELVLEKRGLEIRWKNQVDLRRQREEEELERQNEERQWRAYWEWRGSVREERCSRKRLQDREAEAEQQDAEWRRLELQGRDVLRERELQMQAKLEAALLQASERSNQLQMQGVSPSGALEEAKRLAEAQRTSKEEKEPVRAEQELWDAMLAKNRLQKKQAGAATPRWGVFGH